MNGLNSHLYKKQLISISVQIIRIKILLCLFFENFTLKEKDEYKQYAIFSKAT